MCDDTRQGSSHRRDHVRVATGSGQVRIVTARIGIGIIIAGICSGVVVIVARNGINFPKCTIITLSSISDSHLFNITL